MSACREADLKKLHGKYTTKGNSMKKQALKGRTYEMSPLVKETADATYKPKWDGVPGVKYTGSNVDQERFFTWYIDGMMANSTQFEKLVGELSLMAAEDKDAAVYVKAILDHIEGDKNEK